MAKFTAANVRLQQQRLLLLVWVTFVTVTLVKLAESILLLLSFLEPEKKNDEDELHDSNLRSHRCI